MVSRLTVMLQQREETFYQDLSGMYKETCLTNDATEDKWVTQ